MTNIKKINSINSINIESIDLKNSNNTYINNNSNKIEELDVTENDIDNINNNTITKENVLLSIENNIKQNKKNTNIFNQELYKRINQELVNLSIDKGDTHNATR